VVANERSGANRLQGGVCGGGGDGEKKKPQLINLLCNCLKKN
jgi:hypothetical protein